MLGRLSYDGPIMLGWGAMAREQADAHDIVDELIETRGASGGRPR